MEFVSTLLNIPSSKQTKSVSVASRFDSDLLLTSVNKGIPLLFKSILQEKVSFSHLLYILSQVTASLTRTSFNLLLRFTFFPWNQSHAKAARNAENFSKCNVICTQVTTA